MGVDGYVGGREGVAASTGAAGGALLNANDSNDDAPSPFKGEGGDT